MSIAGWITEMTGGRVQLRNYPGIKQRLGTSDGTEEAPIRWRFKDNIIKSFQRGLMGPNPGSLITVTKD